jgi:hypothetical protein
MKVYVLIFCFGAGMLQNAMERTPMHYVKFWLWCFVNLVAVAATIAELVFAFRAFRWWGLLICYGFFGLPDFIFRHKNPAPFLYVGLASTIFATTLILWR